ncbi:MAG TPA: type II toxin-antitoxin system RelE/ParE family toxin [Candidatus Acidoferrales bacterium]
MTWQVEYTDEFQGWWDGLSVGEQESVAHSVRLLEEAGPNLGRPHAETLAKQSRHSNMKELRVVHHGDAYRVLFAFDPRRVAILLVGGRKPDQKWYKKAIPAADRLFDQHLEALRREGL